MRSFTTPFPGARAARTRGPSLWNATTLSGLSDPWAPGSSLRMPRGTADNETPRTLSRCISRRGDHGADGGFAAGEAGVFVRGAEGRGGARTGLRDASEGAGRSGGAECGRSGRGAGVAARDRERCARCVRAGGVSVLSAAAGNDRGGDGDERKKLHRRFSAPDMDACGQERGEPGHVRRNWDPKA